MRYFLLVIFSFSLSASNFTSIRLPANSWKFIGVSGGFTESIYGVGSDDINTSKFDKNVTERIDDNVSSIVYADDNNNTIVSFRVIDYSSAREFNYANMYVSSEGHTYDGTATHPVMYVYVDNGDGNTTPDIRIQYQSDYEGEEFYIQLNHDIYRGTFDISAVYTNPQKLEAVYIQNSSDVKEENLSIEYVFDRNLKNNSGYYTGNRNSYLHARNHDTIYSGDKLEIYHYNPARKSWDSYIYKDGKVFVADFDKFEKGKGYWILFTPEDNTNDAGLIFGDGNISMSDYDISELVPDDWNMLSFNNGYMFDNSVTGMIVEMNMNSNSNVDISIADEEGRDVLRFQSGYKISGSDEDAEHALHLVIQQLNKKLYYGRAFGTLSNDFKIIAYEMNDSTHKMVLLGNQKFRIADNGADSASGGDDSSIVTATSLTGKPLYIPSLGRNMVLGADINNTYVESLYGEHVLAFEVPGGYDVYDTNTVLGNLGKIYISIGDANKSVVSAEIGNTITKFAENIEKAHSTLKALPIDVDMNGTFDTLLIANSKYDFSIQDGIFYKRYRVNRNASTGANLVVRNSKGGIYETFHLSSSQITGEDIAKVINDNSKYFEANGTNDYLAIATNDINYKDFYLEQSDSNVSRLELITDPETNTTITSDGVIKKVYSIDNLANSLVAVDGSVTIQLYLRGDNWGDGKQITRDNIMEYFLETLTGEIVHLSFGFMDECNLTKEIQKHPLYQDEFVSSYGLNVSLAWQNYDVNVCLSVYDGNQTQDDDEFYKSLASFAEGMYKYFYEINSSLIPNFFVVHDNRSFTIAGAFTLVDFKPQQDHYLETAPKDVGTIKMQDVVVSVSKMSHIPYSIGDLQNNRLYSGGITRDFDNPVVSLQRLTGYKAKKILTTSEDADGGSFSWKFIDLTKDYSDWFNPVDSYNLFTFNKTKGYWVYLDDIDQNYFGNFQAGTDSPNLSVNIVYNHSFVNWTGDINSSSNFTTKNYISSMMIAVDVSDIPDISVIDRVVADFLGYKFRLERYGNLYTTSGDEILDLGDSPTIDLNVTLFTRDHFSAVLSKVIENTPPTRPTITVTNGDLSSVEINTSNNGVAFAVYSGYVDSVGTNLVQSGISVVSSKARIDLCSLAQDFNSNLGAYRFVASTNSNMSYGLVSDIGYIDEYNSTFYPIYKNGSILSVNGDEVDSISTDYNSSCGKVGDASSDYGVKLTGEAGKSVKVAFKAKNTNFEAVSVNDIKTVELKVDGVKVGTIQFDGYTYSSSNDILLMEYNNRIYKTDFGILTNLDTNSCNFTDVNISMLEGQAISI